MSKDKLLIMQLGRFGDLILFTPVFRIIKEKFPDIELHLLAGRKNYEVVLGNPYIDKIIKFDKSPTRILNTLFQIRRNKYKYWIDPRDHYSKESRILGKLSRADKKIGFNKYGSKRVFDVDLKKEVNIIHHSLIGINSLEYLGITLPIKPLRPELFFLENENFSDSTNSIIEKYKDYILLNLSASGEHKMWLLENWIQFIEQTKLYENALVINFMASESSQANSIKKHFPDVVLHNPQNIRDVMSIVFNSNLVVSPDTSVVHIGSAFNKRIFALYSGLDDFFIKFHPTSYDYVVVRAKNGDKGIHSISADEAVEKFLTRIKQ